MAWYKDDSYLVKTSSEHEWWTKTYDPGDRVTVSGIFRCPGCKREIAHNKDASLPPQNHHQHTTTQGKVRWKLIVRSNTDGE